MKRELKIQVLKVWIRNQTCKKQNSDWNFSKYNISLHAQNTQDQKKRNNKLLKKVNMQDNKRNEIP